MVLVDSATGKELHRLRGGGHSTQAALAFAPDGALLATSDVYN
jgi:hypothetical protein